MPRLQDVVVRLRLGLEEAEDRQAGHVRRAELVDELSEAEVPTVEIIVHVNDCNARLACPALEAPDMGGRADRGREKCARSLEVHRIDDVDQEEGDQGRLQLGISHRMTFGTPSSCATRSSRSGAMPAPRARTPSSR